MSASTVSTPKSPATKSVPKPRSKTATNPATKPAEDLTGKLAEALAETKPTRSRKAEPKPNPEEKVSRNPSEPAAGRMRRCPRPEHLGENPLPFSDDTHFALRPMTGTRPGHASGRCRKCHEMDQAARKLGTTPAEIAARVTAGTPLDDILAEAKAPTKAEKPAAAETKAPAKRGKPTPQKVTGRARSTKTTKAEQAS